jgi:hypothetical protein
MLKKGRHIVLGVCERRAYGRGNCPTADIHSVVSRLIASGYSRVYVDGYPVRLVGNFVVFSMRRPGLEATL